MPRLLTATVLAAALLSLGACTSEDAPAPAPASSSAPSAPAPSAAADVSPELTAWAAEFCTAAGALGQVGSLTQPSEAELADPAVAQAFAVDFYTTAAGAFSDAAAGMTAVGAPPVAGQEGFTDQVVTAFTSAAETYQGLAGAASAVDVSDPAALGTVIAGLQDPFGPISAAFAPLQEGASPEVQAALTSTPECAAVGA